MLEIHLEGSAAKDSERNVRWYAELGIPEYFVFDRRHGRLSGFRLSKSKASAYEPIIAQRGRLEAQTLGLWLALEPASAVETLARLRFFAGTAVVPEPDELAERLEVTVADLLAQRAAVETERAETERRLADALAEIERLERER